MKVDVQKNYDDVCKKVANRIAEYLSEKPNSLIELPGGDTPLGIFDELVHLDQGGKINLSECKFVSLDEWGSLDYNTKGSCIQTLYDHLYKRLSIDIDKQVCFFDGKADLQDECKRVDAFIKEQGGIDIAVLGVGMNGHIGFNEPGVNPDQYCTIVPLDDITKEVSIKYFGKQLNLKEGITLGMKHFEEAKEVILIASEEKKADIVKQIVEDEVTIDVPASIMRNVANCTFYVDEAAASKLNTH